MFIFYKNEVIRPTLITAKTNATLNKVLSRIEDGHLNAMVFLYVGKKEECDADLKELDRLGVGYTFL